MSILPLLLHVKTFSQGFMSTKDPGSRRSLIYIATIQKDGTQLSGYYSDSITSQRTKTTYRPKKNSRNKTNKVEKPAPFNP